MGAKSIEQDQLADSAVRSFSVPFAVLPVSYVI